MICLGVLERQMRDKVKRGGFWIDCYSLTPEIARSIDKCSGKMSNLTKGLG